MTWSTLLTWEGHGPYILGAYAMTFIVLGVEVLVLWCRGRQRARREARQTHHDH